MLAALAASITKRLDRVDDAKIASSKRHAPVVAGIIPLGSNRRRSLRSLFDRFGCRPRRTETSPSSVRARLSGRMIGGHCSPK